MPTRLNRRQALLAGAASLAGFVARASVSAAATEVDAALRPVQTFGAALLSLMRAGGGTPFARRYASFEPAVADTFDLDAILRGSVGPHWATMPADQRVALTRAFRRYSVANFVANFASYGGETIEVLPTPRALASGDQVVTTRLAGPTGATVLSYVMRQTENGWKAVDLLADGSISQVATQRSDFRALLNSGGGSALVASLESKVAALSGGALA